MAETTGKDKEDRTNNQEKFLKVYNGGKDNLKLIKDWEKQNINNEFKKGENLIVLIENCVQKADYHIWYDDKYNEINMYKILTKR